MNFYCISKGFHEILRLLYFCTATLEFREKYPHFSHSVQFADFVCKLRALRKGLSFGILFGLLFFALQNKSAEFGKPCFAFAVGE